MLVLVLLAAAAFAAERSTRILVLGDSLTAGYGVAAADTFPVRLEARLRSRGSNPPDPSRVSATAYGGAV